MRQNQANLSEREWDDLIEAMKCLKRSKRSRDWDYFVDTHTKYATHQHDASPHVSGDDLDIHSAYYWLAWHRKFILEFEKQLGTDLPYWNWTTTRRIPEELHKKLFGWMHVARALTHNGDRLPTAAELRDVTEERGYSAFDSGLNDLHGRVHNWVGGDMARPTKSPKDPLFFLHHAFIDKIWADWQAANPTQQFSSELLEATLAPWDDVKVRDVMSISRLGYSYR